MMIAQKLYEGVNTHEGVMGVITYMRTDSLNLAKEAVENARKIHTSKFLARTIFQAKQMYILQRLKALKKLMKLYALQI